MTIRSEHIIYFMGKMKISKEEADKIFARYTEDSLIGWASILGGTKKNHTMNKSPYM